MGKAPGLQVEESEIQSFGLQACKKEKFIDHKTLHLSVTVVWEMKG